MSDLGNITALKASNLAILNNSVPDESIDPSDHNQTMIDTIDTLTNGVVLQAPLVSGANIKTVNSQSLLGSGNLDLRGDFRATTFYNSKNLIQNKPILFPAINFLDGNAVPPAAFTNDIYVLIDLGNGAVNAGWDGANYNDWVINDGTDWQNQSPTNGATCYDKAASVNKRFNGITWVEEGGATGKVAIYDANGKPTFYSDFATAYAAYTTGQVINLFADVTITTALELKTTIIQGNGYKIKNDDNNAVHCFIKATGTTATLNWFNLTIEKNNGSGKCLFGTAGTIKYTGSNVNWNNNGTGESIVFAGSSGTFDGFRCYAAANYALDSASSIIPKNGYCYAPTYAIAVRIEVGEAYNITGESITGTGLLVDVGAVVYDSLGISVSGKPLAYIATGGTYIRTNGKSASGIVGQSATYEACFLESSSGIAAQSATIKGGNLKSSSNYASAYCSTKLAVIESTSSVPVLVAGNEKIINCSIKTSLNTSGGYGIDGAATGVEITNTHIEIVNASAYGINITSGFFNNVKVKGGVWINPVTTISNTSASDAYGNGQII